jgi:hypothetical protein
MSELVTSATPVQRVLGIKHWVTIKGVKRQPRFARMDALCAPSSPSG